MGAENDADDEACLATVQLGKPVPGSTADTVQLANPGSASAMIRTLAGESIAPFATAENHDRYIAGELLGAGGMGEVRSQTDRATGRSVAMKTMHVDSDAVAMRRFSREARIQSQLEHPSIVPVYDIGQSGGGVPYITMKLVRGESLAKVCTQLRAGDEDAEKRYTQRKLLTILSTVALTLEFVHQRGVIHRDLKPENIMLGPFGEVYILDWGLAAMIDEHEKVSIASASTDIRRALAASTTPVLDTPGRFQTAAGLLLGTPGYIAPELLEPDAEATIRSDIYALGAILFEILTFERLHKGEGIGQILGSTMTIEEASPHERQPWRELAPELDALCRAATKKDPKQRLASAGEIARAIEAFLDGERDHVRRRELAAEITKSARAMLAVSNAMARSTGEFEAKPRPPSLSPDKGDRSKVGDARFIEARPPEVSDAASARSAALREVTTAIGLDPDNAEAKALLVRLLTEPPPNADLLAEEIGREDAVKAFRVAARTHAIVQLSYLIYIPLLAWMGIRSWWMFLATGTVISAVFFAAIYYYKYPPKNLQLPLPHFLLSLAALASGGMLFGPLILVPGITVATGVAYLASFDRRISWIIAGTMSVVLVPAALQFAGVIPPNYDLVDGKLVVLPMMTELPPLPTAILLLVTHAIVIGASMYFAWQLRKAYTTVAKAVRLQAWQLSQLVPETARRDVVK